MSTDLAPVTPSILKWARETIGVSPDLAAKRAGVTPERLRAWEAGEAEPTLAKLRSLSKLYQRPLSVFFLPEPPRNFQTIQDFRRIQGHIDQPWSRNLHRVFRRAIEQKEIVRELLEDDPDEHPLNIPSLGLDADPEDASQVGREALGISLEEQFSWNRPEEAFAGWLESVEKLGIFVLRSSDVSFKEMRGFSISDAMAPVVVVNALDSPRGQVFTLIHEFVHLMLREGGLCTLAEPDAGSARRIEVFCNAVAAAILMPAEPFLGTEVVAPVGIREWDEDVLISLGRKFGVSREAVLRRLLTLRRTSWDFYIAKRTEYLAAYEEQRELEKAKRRGKESSGGPPPHTMAIRDSGKPYVRLVLDAYYREAITPSTVSSALGLKLKHLPKLERAALGPR